MGSRKPPWGISFTLTGTTYVAPTLCRVCGANASCVRRRPNGRREELVFQCNGCGRETVRLADTMRESDAEIEALAERMSGIAPRPRRKDWPPA